MTPVTLCATSAFRSTLPRGERRSATTDKRGQCSFDPRSRVGSDRADCRSRHACGRFDPRSRVGSDRAGRRLYAPPLVSIHAPAWGATPQSDCPRGWRCFDPRSRVGSDRVLTERSKLLGVSIHAPAWGATAGDEGAVARLVVSIHAPAWGATVAFPQSQANIQFRSTLPRGERQRCVRHPAVPGCFDPRSRVGSDVRRADVQCHVVVSIHAPAWGATCVLHHFEYLKPFRSTLPRGERPGSRRVRSLCAVSIHAPAWGATTPAGTIITGRGFRSTLPRGERPARPAQYRNLTSFDPRSRVGSDRSQPGVMPACAVSIHAPAWGAT